MNYKSIFISDLHLGGKHTQIRALIKFLKENESENLFLVGDIIDGWALKRKWGWTANCNLIVQKILRKARKGTRVVYLAGNHDEFLRDFLFIENFGDIELADEMTYSAVNGKKYLILHGDKFDGLLSKIEFLQKLGSVAYDWLLEFNTYFNFFRRKLGFGYWSLSYFLKKNTKKVIKYCNSYEDAVAFEAKRNECDGVICGHLHIPAYKIIDNVEYLNCGCWVEMATAIVEHFDGKFELLVLE